ncbi:MULTISPECIES: LysR family transcriptional regulator [unclassified Chelatococcus]|jgi:DNA-binding transcriptional LysR family regulator|uniref:LysR family transcriptional regulator n=1 Tax=unclassified Chelatococcus TaxID=2638111 RepID=UPI001BD01CF1|nr:MULTISPECIES: LysR family transcriptional regulator [unclassified Chelatococcus]CAH1652694.1 LysR family transcriptional regulator [Hyphomicrobiales bacterium]MBS7742998.1 LysR family transcriptional regulator [Chelatococcus sp. HY11]MBX3541884.1 LysR family transcriptional regulator [Chelatococcus sp.]MCO5074225.1 LysR family transcriptional regulator [Chelatococcus sp.]CAH1693998.1 LysR family transcriptional regulator [Hyphomicrobiales bacterium]
MDLAAALRAFVRTVERGSVTAAARDLGISQPAVTKHLRNLERHVGARLLERSSRVVRPTSQGQALYEGSHEALTAIEAALEGVRRDMGAIEGNIRIHAPTCLGAKHLHGIVMAFQRQHPGVMADLILENRDIDLIYDNFDLAIRYGRPSGQNLIIRQLGWIERILVASPHYLERFGPIATTDKLSEAGVIVSARLPVPRDLISLRHHTGETVDVPVNAVLRTNSADVIASTLVSGHALGPVQRLLVADELADGRLVRVLPEYEVKPTEAFLAYPSVRFMRPVVRAFTDFAIPALRAIDGVAANNFSANELMAV